MRRALKMAPKIESSGAALPASCVRTWSWVDKAGRGPAWDGRAVPGSYRSNSSEHKPGASLHLSNRPVCTSQGLVLKFYGKTLICLIKIFHDFKFVPYCPAKLAFWTLSWTSIYQNPTFSCLYFSPGNVLGASLVQPADVTALSKSFLILAM